MTETSAHAASRTAAARTTPSRPLRLLGVAAAAIAAALASATPADALVAAPQIAAPMSIADAPLPKVDDRDVFLSPFLSSEKPSEESGRRAKAKSQVALPEGAIEVDFLPELVDAIPANRIFSLVQFPLPDGTLRDLWLTEFKVTNDSTTIVVMEPGKTGDPVANETHVPDARLFQGHVIGEEESLVYLSFSSTGVAGFVNFGNQRLVVSNGPMGEGPVVISDLNALPEGAINWTQHACGTLPGDEPPAAGDGGVAALGVCRVIELAIETDNEYRAMFSSNQAAINYAVQVMGGLNAIYKNQMNLVPVMNYLRVWATGVADPWNAGDALDQLNQFRIAWAGGGPAGSNPRDLAHMFSGRPLGGGSAYLSVVCNASFGFAVSANLNGFFPFPLINNNSQNWDIMVIAHEMGHNVGCNHTHDLGVDGCGSTPENCSGASNGTIMSYCHQCPGGMSNIVLNFAAANISQMDAYLPGLGCLADACGIHQHQPSGFTATDGTFTDAVRLTWTGAASAPIRYEIQRRVVGGTFVMLNGNVSPSATGYDDTTALLNTYYQYRIRAIRFDGVATDWSIPDLGFRTLNPPSCATDLSRDGVVDASDLSVLLAGWGGPGADIDGSGATDANDLALLLADWGATCSPLLWAMVLEYTPNPAVVTNAQLRSAIAATGLPWRVRDNATQAEMLLVPPGTFDMGCVEASLNVGCAPAELPAHPVTITRPYYLGRYELTQLQWSIVMGSNPSLFQGMDRPVEQVNFDQIQAFLQQTGLRLPTEAEYERACRAGASAPFPATAAFPAGSNNDGLVGRIAWWFLNASGETKPVGGLASNGLGLHDMLGNVYEFTSDWYGPYAPESSNNPTGPASGTAKVMRGGSWTSTQDGVRSSFRASSPTNSYSSNRGFRVARSTGGSLAWATVLEQTPSPAIVTDPSLRAALIATGLPWRVRDNATQIELLLVPPGTFTMGCNFGSSDWPCYAEELPTHQVNLLAAYYIGRYEVTQAEWQARMGSNPSRFQGSQYPGAPNRPVEQVTWTQVQGFLGNTGLRLPTEAEWEYACRAGTATPYHGGPGFLNGTADDGVVTSMSWGYFNSTGRTDGIGGRTANALGFHDMLGNVYELVGDRFGFYTASAQTDPTGPASGTDRVMRGGGWTSTPDGLRASTRQAVAPTTWMSNLGFRVAKSP